MSKAEYIHYDPPTKRLVAVYKPGTDLEVLRPIAQRIAAHASLKAEVKVKRVKQGGRLVSTPGIEITSPGGVHYPSTCALVKQLTNPNLVFTAAYGILRVGICACGRAGAQVATAFLLGLEPEDVQGFTETMRSEVVHNIPMEDMLQALRDRRRAHSVLELLDAAYRKRGADVAELRLESAQTPACQHPPVDRDLEQL